MHDHVIVTDKNVRSLYYTVNYVTNTVEVKLLLFKSVVLRMGSYDLFSRFFISWLDQYWG